MPYLGKEGDGIHNVDAWLQQGCCCTLCAVLYTALAPKREGEVCALIDGVYHVENLHS